MKADHIDQVLVDGVAHGLKPYDYGKAMARISETGIRVDMYFGWQTIETPKTLEQKFDDICNSLIEEEIRRQERESENQKRERTDHPCDYCGKIIPSGSKAKYCCKSCRNKSRYRLDTRKKQRLDGME